MKDTPPLLIISRQRMAHLGAAKVALDTLAVASGTTTGISSYSSVLAGTKIALILPIIASLVGVLSLLARTVLSYYMGVAVTSNPINSNSTTVISQPDPITPKADVQPKSTLTEI